MADSESIKAIELVRSVFEHIHGNLGVLRFSVDRLVPKSDAVGEWIVECSFFESLGSSQKSKYKVQVNIKKKTVEIERINGSDHPKQKFSVKEDKVPE